MQQYILDNRLQDQLNDPEAQRKLGRLTAVRLLATGTVLPSAQLVRVMVRLIDLQDGRIVASAQGSVALSEVADDIRRVVGRGAGCELGGGGPGAAIVPPALAPARQAGAEEAALAELERGGLRVSLLRGAAGPAARIWTSRCCCVTQPQANWRSIWLPARSVARFPATSC